MAHPVLGRILAELAALPVVPPELDVRLCCWEMESRIEYMLAVHTAQRLAQSWDALH